MTAQGEGSDFGRRANRAFGPVVAGLILDLVDLATFGPIGFFVGIPVGLAAGYWLGSCLGLERRHCVLCAMAAALYCTMPGTEFLPLGTLVGAFARFWESGRKKEQDPPAGSG